MCERSVGLSMTTMELDGSPVLLGHCEIRIRDQDGTVYAAPSLLPHYMAAHHYLPPPGVLQALRQGTE